MTSKVFYPLDADLKFYQHHGVWHCRSVNGYGLVVGIGYNEKEAKIEWKLEYERTVKELTKQ